MLTLLSVMVAFILFGLLQGINAGFHAAVEAAQLDRLFSEPRVPGGNPMPVSAAEKILAVPGVAGAAGRTVFLGYYQNPRNRMFALATSVESYLAVRRDYAMAPQYVAAMKNNRAGIAMTPALRDRLQLKLGDKVPLHSAIARKDGNPVWTFELVAILDDVDRPGQKSMALVNYDYFDETRLLNSDTFDVIIVQIADPTRSVQVARLIDALFANSPAETRTYSEQQEAEVALQRFGDFQFFTNAICGAVFFALLFITANTMIQSGRERVPEFAVLKTLGFSNVGVLSIVVAEATLLCGVAAVLGLGIAAVLFPRLKSFIGLQHFHWQVAAAGMGVAVILALISAALPAMRARRLRIVEALRR
ncbi:MAG TPA: ABC transporter permease [Povalibacter sp.]|nr:ABC transporter permease [Povalibacter sp.]